MGCFCAQAVEAMARDDQPNTAVEDNAQDLDQDPVMPAIHEWLSSRLLPARAWEPDPDWMDVDLPDPPMPPEALGVLVNLVQTYRTTQDELQLDLTDPEAASKLTRIVATLNRRTPILEALADDRPWEQVALYNDQIEAVHDAVVNNVIGNAQEVADTPPVSPWRPLIRKLRALAPLVAVAGLTEIDPADTDALAQLVRKLRAVALPPLEDPVLVLRTISRLSAVARLRSSFGADPRTVPFERVKRALERKAAAVQAMLPENIRMEDGNLVGMPLHEANPSQLVNADIIEQAQKIVPDQMRWQPPPRDELDLLTVAAPVLALTRAMTAIGPSPIRTSPCGHTCDAGAVGRAIASRDSGTGAAPAR